MSGNRLVLSHSTFFIKFKECLTIALLRASKNRLPLVSPQIDLENSRYILGLQPPMRKLWERMHTFTMRGVGNPHVTVRRM